MEYYGVKLGLTPKVRIIHDHQENTSQVSEEYKQYRAEQCRIVEYVNVLKPLSVQGYLRYLYRKLLVSLFLFKKQSITQYVEEIKLLQKYKNQIQNSRKINSIKQPSWL